MFTVMERQNEKLVKSMMKFLKTDQQEEIVVQKVKYALQVIVSEVEKLIILLMIFGISYRICCSCNNKNLCGRKSCQNFFGLCAVYIYYVCLYSDWCRLFYTKQVYLQWCGNSDYDKYME